MPTFAEKLHEIRRERGITQEQLAHEMNVSRPTISHWENGRVIPDIDTIKHLSQVLEYNFLAVEGLTEEAQAAPIAEEIPETAVPVQTAPEKAATVPPVQAASESASAQTPLPQKGFNKRAVISAVLGAAVLCAVLVVCLLAGGKPSGELASVSITSAENPVKAIRFEEFPDGVGWFYEFRIEETSGIPFTVSEAIHTTYGENDFEDVQTFTAEQLADIWGSATLTQNVPQSWTGGFPLQPVKGVGIVLKGADANGNELEFKGYIELSKEIAE